METLKSMLHSLKGKLSMRWKQDYFYTAVCPNPQVLLGCQIILACHGIFWGHSVSHCIYCSAFIGDLQQNL